MATVEELYEHLEKTIRGYNISADLNQIRSAFEYAQEHHGHQLRRDGTPYITHPLQVAQIVAAQLPDSFTYPVLPPRTVAAPLSLSSMRRMNQLESTIPSGWRLDGSV